jgi:sporulation protein YlmC with PRC-barrel domain
VVFHRQPRQEEAMAETNAPGERTGKPLIESDRVEGTAVYDMSGAHIGTIKRLMIEKISGKVAYVVVSFGGLLSVGEDEHIIPWAKLNYDTSLGGYRTDITEEQVRGAPTFYHAEGYDWLDRNKERGLAEYYGVPFYSGV